MMQQSQTLFESSVLSATSFRTVYHEHGRYKTINGNSFVHDGHAYRIKEGANKRGNSSRLTQSFHFFMFEPI
ncbi:hypothetical protein M8O30_23490, partial [Enterobacter roggenkampii]|nr:hypothetical protein [Enterobacter roggenkampii]